MAQCGDSGPSRRPGPAATLLRLSAFPPGPARIRDTNPASPPTPTSRARLGVLGPPTRGPGPRSPRSARVVAVDDDLTQHGSHARTVSRRAYVVPPLSWSGRRDPGPGRHKALANARI